MSVKVKYTGETIYNSKRVASFVPGTTRELDFDVAKYLASSFPKNFKIIDEEKKEKKEEPQSDSSVVKTKEDEPVKQSKVNKSRKK
jgi:hypothetical protein